MVCTHCGTLNPEEGGRCVHCGRSLAATEADMCAAHPERRAVARCSRCDAPLCDDCVVRVEGSPYCADHAEALTATPAEEYLRQAPVVDPRQRPVATFLQRIEAGLIDLALIGAYWLILYMLVWALAGSPPNLPDAGAWRPVFWLLAVLGSLGYLAYAYASSGSTAGMNAMDLIALRDDGALMEPGTAALRALLAALGFLLGGITFWAILWDEGHRALHDRWTGTVVLSESGTVSEPMPVEQ